MYRFVSIYCFSKQNAINTHPWVEMVSTKLTVVEQYFAQTGDFLRGRHTSRIWLNPTGIFF